MLNFNTNSSVTQNPMLRLLLEETEFKRSCGEEAPVANAAVNLAIHWPRLPRTLLMRAGVSVATVTLEHTHQNELMSSCYVCPRNVRLVSV